MEFRSAHRPVAMGTQGMVAAAHQLASLAGLDVLRAGGNAVDAAIATNAALNVTQPGACGIGGDLFAMVYWAEHKRVYMLNASGRAPAAANVEAFTARGDADMPVYGILTVTVPGCVDGWFSLAERFASKPMSTLLAPAITLAGDGYPISQNVCQQIRIALERLHPHASWIAAFAPDGQAPTPGTRYKLSDLAHTLNLIAAQGRDAFYTGPLAQAIVNISQELGGLLRLEDLAEHYSTWEEPLATEYRGLRILEAPPNTQGVTALEMLNICSGWPLGELAWDDPLRVHRMVEAKKLAFIDRNRYIGDPAQVSMPLQMLLSKEHAAQLRAQVMDDKAAPAVALPPGDGDTTYFATADKFGNVVSCIQSNFRGFGALVVPWGTGISLHNRGSYFRLDTMHANCIAPRKRPFHTLIPAMAFAGEELVGAFGTMGADGQPQTHLQVLSNIVDHGFNIQEAIEAPRWVHGPLQLGDPPDLLRMEARFSPNLIAALQDLGHNVTIVKHLDAQMGHAQAIWRSNGTFFGGADPRGDGVALGC